MKLIVSALSEVEITLKLDVCGFFLLDLNKARTTHNLSVTQEGFSLGKETARYISDRGLHISDAVLYALVGACIFFSAIFVCVG